MASDVTEILGDTQLAWLLRRRRRSRATWKVIASDMPVGLVVPDGSRAQDGIAQGRPEALGREHEIARLLSWMKADGVRFQRAADSHVAVDGDSGVMTVRLMDVAGDTLYSVDLEPQRAR